MFEGRMRKLTSAGLHGLYQWGRPYIAWSPESTEVVYIDPLRGLVILDINGRKRSVKTRVPPEGGMPLAWSPTGDEIAFCHTSQTLLPLVEIWTKNLRTGKELKLTDEARLFTDTLTFSLDGQWLSFEGPKMGVPGHKVIVMKRVGIENWPNVRTIRRVEERPYPAIWIVSADGKESFQLTKERRCYDLNPSFSPVSGGPIAFTRFRIKPKMKLWDVWLVDLKGKKEMPLTKDGRSLHPCWAPEGRRLAFFRYWGGRPSIWVTSVESFKSRRITPLADPEGGIHWSPDGRRIFYVRGGDLWMADLEEGRNRCLLISAGIVKWSLKLSPDGKKVAFSRTTRGKVELCIFELPPELWPGE